MLVGDLWMFNMVCWWFSSFIGRIAIVWRALAGIGWSAHASDDVEPQWREDRIKLRIVTLAECAQFALDGLVRQTAGAVLRITIRSRPECMGSRMQYIVRAKPSTGVASDAGDAATVPGWGASRRGHTVAQGSFRGQAARRRGGLGLNIGGTFSSGCRKGARSRLRSSPLISAARTCMSICAP